jgi:hypothetical protein
MKGDGVLNEKEQFALRLQPSLLAEARKVADTEGVALNQLINVALAEKLSALRTASYFAERTAPPIPEALRILTGQVSDSRLSKATISPTRHQRNARLGEGEISSDIRGSTVEILALVIESQVTAWLYRAEIW